MRTTEEIKTRIVSPESEDFLGTQRGDLIGYLTYEDAKEYLKDDYDGADWEVLPRDRDSVLAEMRAYMPFAWDKADNERGISAGRSMMHYRTWVWMIGDENEVPDLRVYSDYGKPHLRLISERYGWGDPAELESVAP